MAEIINLKDWRAAHTARGHHGKGAREVLIVPISVGSFETEPWVAEFWTGIATLVSLFAACISFEPDQK